MRIGGQRRVNGWGPSIWSITSILKQGRRNMWYGDWLRASWFALHQSFTSDHLPSSSRKVTSRSLTISTEIIRDNESIMSMLFDCCPLQNHTQIIRFYKLLRQKCLSCKFDLYVYSFSHANISISDLKEAMAFSRKHTNALKPSLFLTSSAA